jgi:hypothetical protein
MFLAMPSSHVKPAGEGRAGWRATDVDRHTETFAAATADLLGSP